MKKKFFKRAAAFGVASLMAVGVITVLPDECLPQIGSVVSAEEVEVGGVAINEANFPDEIFRSYVSDNFDNDSDDCLSDSEINHIIVLRPLDSGIKSLKGIEYFTKITELSCWGNQLTSLDVSNNTALKTLQCNANQLTSLDVSNNIALTFLDCSQNQLTSLDIKNNTMLSVLNCHTNQISSLDVSNNTDLTSLGCSSNQLTSLDVSNNIALEGLNCDNNLLMSINVRKNTVLNSLSCSDNQLTSIDVSQNTALTSLYCDGNQLTSLDISKNAALERLECFNNQLISLNVSGNTALTWLYCWGNQLTSLDLSSNLLLTTFSCDGNNGNIYYIGETCGVYNLANLPIGFDVTKTSNWRGATIEDSKLTGISKIGSAIYQGYSVIYYDYDCGNSKTARFDLTYSFVDHSYDDGVITTEPTEQSEGEKTYTCTNCGATKTEVIEKLDHIHNKGDELVSDETGHWYTCDGCDEKLDFATHTEDSGTVTVEPTVTTDGQKTYKCTVCGYTTRTEVVSKLEQVGGIEINAVNFPDEVFRQYVSENFDTDNDDLLSNEEISRITEIDKQSCGIKSLKGIEYFTSLTFLRCNINQLTSLDVSKNIALTFLSCGDNQLTSLNVSNNIALEQLSCDFNQITTLDVSNNTALTYLSCQGNLLTTLDVSNNTALKTLQLDKNQLTSLNISKNTALTRLGCGSNQLTTLDVSKHSALTSLQCNGNQLTSLDVSKNTVLTFLQCSDNSLTSLDVNNNTALTYLGCVDNRFNIGETCGAYNLANLPVSFDVNKTSNWQGATLGNGKLIGIDGAGTIKYDYDCGNGKTATFTLTYDYIDHSYDDGVITTDPTEKAEGEKTYTCTVCGATKTEVIEKLAHVHNQGTELKSDATGHWYTCSGCDEKLDFSTHTEDSGTVTVEPTETTEGEKVYKCTVCGHTTRTDVIEKLDHVHNKGDELVSDETGHWYTCSGCDEKLDFSTHMEDSGTITVEPTETTEGEKIYKCTVCGHTTRTDVIAKLEHVHNKGNELVSDETGHWYICSGCDEKLDFSTHTEDNGMVTVEPTETTEGEKVYKCTVCGYTTRTKTIAKLGGGSNNPTVPTRPSQPSEPSNPTQPSNPSQTQQPDTNESETNISVKKGWGNVVKEINKANDNSKINVDMGNSTNVPKNVMNAIKGKNVDIVLDMGDGITWTINGKDVTDPQSIDFSVTKKKNQIPEDMISDPSNTIPLVLAHNGSFGCSATLSIDLKDNDNKIANLYYYNTKTKELEFVDSSVIVNGKANLVFTHASDWAIVISDTSAAYEDVSSAAGAYETDDNSQAPLCIIVIILTALGFSYIIITKRLTKHKR